MMLLDPGLSTSHCHLRFAQRMSIIGWGQHMLRHHRQTLVPRVLACFGILVLGNAALGQEQRFCDLDGQGADWRLSVSPDGATISFPRDPSRRPDGSGSTTAVRIGIGPSGKVRGSLVADYVSPKGSLLSLPAKGAAATAMLRSLPEGGIRMSGAFKLVAISPDSSSSAAPNGMTFLFPLAARDAAVLEAFLTKADQQGRELQLAILAGPQTIVQYLFMATGFQRARKIAVEAIAELNVAINREFETRAAGEPNGVYPRCAFVRRRSDYR